MPTVKINYIGQFIKHFSKRIEPYPHIRSRFDDRIKMFIENPGNPILKNHSLKGSKSGLKSFSITGDIRVLYFLKKNIIYFVDIGSHNQVY